MRKRLFKTAAVLGSVFALLLGYCLFVIFTGKGIGCPFHLLTGLDCPGCGNTRAVLAILRLDIKAALEYNPLIFAEILYILWAVIYTSAVYVRTGNYKLEVRPLWVNVMFLVLFVGWGIVRNII